MRKSSTAALEASGAVVLDRIWNLIEGRRASGTSHSARLLARGRRHVIRKLGEEALELMIEAMGDDRSAMVLESADVLYHLLIVWISAGLNPNEVWAELERREAASRGARVEALETTKIP